MLALLLSVPSLVSYVLCFILLYAIKLIGDKKIQGFYLGIATEVGWTLYGVWIHTPGLCILSIMIAGIYLRNVREWKKNPPVTNP